MKWFFWVIFLFVQPLYAADFPLKEIKASTVDYDGKRVHLAGAVEIHHRFGKLFCNKAIILLSQNSSEQKQMIASQILLFGNVKVYLQDGTILLSDEADINCKTLEGLFRSKEPSKVMYSTFLHDAGKKIPMKATAKAMRVKMKKVEEAGSTEYVFTDIHGEDAVSIEYQFKE